MGKSKKTHNHPAKPSKGSGGKDNKGKLQGSKNMFKVKSSKANKSKHKTKAITSTLSRMINQRKTQPSASESNKVYSNIQDTLHGSKVTDQGRKVASDQTRQTKIEREPVNMDEATEQLASL
ncbi:uncharacterized protein [Apostichopus japonicus]